MVCLGHANVDATVYMQCNTCPPPEPCGNSICGYGETVVSCPADCGTCYDGSQNQGETGIDCGGPCFACLTGLWINVPGLYTAVGAYSSVNPAEVRPCSESCAAIGQVSARDRDGRHCASGEQMARVGQGNGAAGINYQYGTRTVGALGQQADPMR